MIVNHAAVLLLCGVIATGLLAGYYDYREQRIPNLLLLFSLLFAIGVFGYILFITDASVLKTVLRRSLFGMIISGVIMFVPYKLNQLAAGDVKLAMVFGFYFGPIGSFLAILNGGIIGGVWALWISWQQGGLDKVWINMKTMALSAYNTGFKDLQWDLDSEGAIKMPYGVALSAGAILVALWQLTYQFKF